MTVEVINTGTELLLGHTLNSHLVFLGQELFPLGLRISRQTTVPDGSSIGVALKEALNRAGIILVTGGLGPTTDDLTREITAELLGLDLLPNAQVMSEITARFARRGLPMTDRVARQAQIPRGATVLRNAHGTAPGLYLTAEPDPSIGPRHIFLLPGPPRELKPMFQDAVRPLLLEIAPLGAGVQSRTFRVAGLGESNVEALVGDKLLSIPGLELGYCARPGEVEIRCIGTAAIVAQAEAIILPAVAEHLVSADDRTLEEVVVAKLTADAQTLAVAESCTGGFLANRITNIPGASAVFLEGFVTYANEAKVRSLGVDPALIESHGAVSREVAAAMAEGACRVTGARHALATTGVAGPGGGTEAKPVGTVFVARASTSAATEVEHHRFPTDRETFKWLASQAALDLLRRAL